MRYDIPLMKSFEHAKLRVINIRKNHVEKFGYDICIQEKKKYKHNLQ